MKDSEIFNERERRLLYSKKPELRPIKVPSINEAKTIRVPSINEAVLLTQPSIDQIIVEFLKQYDVNVKPQNVGSWNGWDTIATLDAFMNRGSGGSTIANTLFYASRSNQVSQSAQDWQTWKRWALDHKNFDQYKDEVIQSININNENAIKEVEESIRRAELHNKNAIKEVEESIRRAELHNENLVKKLQKQKIELKEYVSQLIESENLQIAKLQKKRTKIIKILGFSIMSLTLISVIFTTGYQYLTRPKLSGVNKQIKLNRNNKYAQEAMKSFNYGNSAFKSGNFDTAIYWYKDALELDKNLPGVNYALGLTYYKHSLKNGKLYRQCYAKDYLEKVKSKDPDFQNAITLLDKIQCNF